MAANAEDAFTMLRDISLEIVDVEPELFTADAKLAETLGMDSVHLIEIAGQIESAIGTRLEDRELYDLVTVQDFVDLVVTKSGSS